MIPPLPIAAIFLGGLALCGVVLHIVAVRRLRRHFAGIGVPPPAAGGLLTPITHWRAVKRGVRDLEEKLANFIEAGREGDQFLIGVDAGAPGEALAHAVRARFPTRDIVVVSCEPGRAKNPKVSKFIQMAPHARHEHWLLTDSEALIDRDFVESFRDEWAGWDALTAGYRFEGARSTVQALDAAPALLTLWPGLMLANKLDFTLGACTGVKAAAIREMGGWEALGGYLAEDRELGLRLVAQGQRLGLSRHVLSIEADAMSVKGWLLHQHRVAVTYRLATAAGALGLPVLYALPLAVAAAFAGGGGAWWLVPAGVYFLRMMATRTASQLMGFYLPALPLVVLGAPMVEFCCWALAWLPLPVWWSGRWRRLG